MERNKLQEFTFRTTQASRSELIVIMYDVILTDTKAARKALEREDLAAYERELSHAARFLNELMGALDYRFAIAHDLLSLYSYVNKTMIQARMKKDAALLDITDDILGKLRDAFKEVSAQDSSGPIMQNTEKVYAGLTYGRGTLNEALLDPNASRRGFMA